MKWKTEMKFAYRPVKCDCGHTVWLEKYCCVGYRNVHIGGGKTSDVPIYKCLECYNQKE